jgi:hypothetical protein
MAKGQEAVDEGARSATRFLEQIADGQCNADLSHALHKLGLKLGSECRQRNDKVSGEVTLRLKITAEPSGVVAVLYEVNAKEPKARTSGSVFWLTKGGNFTADNPRQTSIPGIREVKIIGEVRDVAQVVNDNNGQAPEEGV